VSRDPHSGLTVFLVVVFGVIAAMYVYVLLERV
jgi:hypothetical protein